VNLPGRTTLRYDHPPLHRTVRLPGGPFETFGTGSVTVRYTGAKDWRQLVARVSGWFNSTVGGAPIHARSGVVKIPLLGTALFLPRGKPIHLKLDEISGYGSGQAGGVFNGYRARDRRITITRVTLHLSLLQRAVSR
jgi:hypothetical protein